MRTLKFKSRLHNSVFRGRQSKLRSQAMKHRNIQNGSKSTNHKPGPFEPVKVKFCFLRGPLRWLTAAKNAIVSWVLNVRIRTFVKSAVNGNCLILGSHSKGCLFQPIFLKVSISSILFLLFLGSSSAISSSSAKNCWASSPSAVSYSASMAS